MRVIVHGASVVADSRESFAVYLLEVFEGESRWTLTRRWSEVRALAQADEDDDAELSLVGAAAEEESEEYEEAAELCSVERGRSPLVSAFRTPHFAVEMVRVGPTGSPDARTPDAS